MTDTAAAINDIFTRMPGRLDAQAAAGLDAVIQFNLSGEGGGVWHCAINRGCRHVLDTSFPVGLEPMSTTAFDTLATVRALEQAGMDPAQAEAVTGAIGGAVSSTETVSRADLDALRADVRADLAALEVRLIRWAIGSALGTAALTIAAVGLLFRLLG